MINKVNFVNKGVKLTLNLRNLSAFLKRFFCFVDSFKGG